MPSLEPSILFLQPSTVAADRVRYQRQPSSLPRPRPDPLSVGSPSINTGMAEIGELDGNNDNNMVAVHIATNEPASRRRLRSLVWNDFTKEQRADGNCIAICNHCKKELSASSRSGTTHLKNHLATCLNTKVRKRRKLVVRRLKGDRNDEANLDFSHFDQKLSQLDLARMIVRHGYSFTIINDSGFKTFVKNLQPQFMFMSPDVVRADCMKIYESERIKLWELLGKLPCRISLSVDMWRSNEGAEYLCLSCHYVDDDWMLKRKAINFLHVEPRIPGREIKEIIKEKLHDWNLQGKLFSFVSINCNESDVVAKELHQSLLSEKLIPVNGKFFLLRHVPSDLNEIAEEVIGLAHDIVNKVRENVQYVKSSPALVTAFQVAAGKSGAHQKSLPFDDLNNWISTYWMLETACECQAGFNCITEYDSEYANSLSSEEWDLVKAVTEFLSVFYHALAKFSAMKIPTSNLSFNDVCGIQLLLKSWKVSELPLIAAMATQILEKVEKNWDSTLLVMAISSILDPRYKTKSIEFFFNTIYDDSNERIDKIHQYLIALYDEYKLYSNDLSNNQAFLCYYENNDSGSSFELKAGAASKTPPRALFDAQRGLDQYLQETSSNQSQKSDLELYLDEAVYLYKGPEDNFNILSWWKFHAAKYPVLSLMARDILAIPVSAVAPSSENRVLDAFCSSQDPVTVQGLICAQDWLEEEFEEPPGPADDVATLPLTAKLDGDIDEYMMPENGD